MKGTLETCDPLDSRQFHLAVRKLADDISFGNDRSPYVGSGIDYVQSRLYQPGDPIKSIDWKITAKTGKVFVKEFEAPKRLPFYLLVDTSASMTIRSGVLSKYALAVQIAGGLALAALDRVSPAGVLGVGERGLHIRPTLSRDAVFRWLHELRHFRYDESTTLAQRLSELAVQLPSRAVLVVLSDMHDPAALAPLKLVAQKHDLIVVQLMDPAERGIRGAGFFRGSEAETGHEFAAGGRRSFDAFQLEVGRALKLAGIDHLKLVTDGPIAKPLRHFFERRAHLRGKAR